MFGAHPAKEFRGKKWGSQLNTSPVCRDSPTCSDPEGYQVT
jgi:hypothetical protein